MKYPEILQAIEANQKAIAAFGKFDKEVLDKINYKLRLDWNYYSNRMEGGTLTREETRSVMVGNIDVQGKPLKDVFEMNGHDKVVLEVLKMSTTELSLSERRIKEIHLAIMHEENPEYAKLIGNWKIDANEIINYRGEKIPFSVPSEVAEKVHKLLDRTNAILSNKLANSSIQDALELAAQFHIDFVTIHPFYDGNGRVSRILTNILLIAAGLPPIVIKDEHKKIYYQFLADIQVYGGKTDLFYAFIGERVLETQQLILSALKGESIEEEDDNAKRLSLIEKRLAAIPEEDEVKLHFAPNVLLNHYEIWMKQFISDCLREICKLNVLFTSPAHRIFMKNSLINAELINENLDKLTNDVEQQLKDYTGANTLLKDEKIVISTFYGPFKKGGTKTFGCSFDLEIHFEYLKWYIDYPVLTEHGTVNRINSESMLLHKYPDNNTQNEITQQFIKTILDYIEFQIRTKGIV